MLSLLLTASLCLVSCSNARPQIYDTPHVESFLTQHDSSEYVVLLSYGGTASNSISEPIIKNDNGSVRVSFTNKKVKGVNFNSLHTSFRSFSGADRQASAIIKITEELNSISYLYQGEWKQIWPLIE